MTIHQITKKIPKFRPYLSMEELETLISLCTDALCAVPAPNLPKILLIKSSARALMKTKISVDTGIQGAAYVATPVPSLNEKLGFGVEEKPLPDFQNLMNAIESAAASSNPETPED